MIERLQRALEHVEELSPEAQEELAKRIEELMAAHSIQVALSYAGAWSDLPEDDEAETLDQIRHASPPTPPIEEQLAWLDEDADE